MIHPEQQYLSSLKDILDVANEHENRTGVNTYRTLGVMHKYDFKHGFPLFTTKKVYWKGIKIELLWFLKGDTNIKFLIDNGVKIWNDDAYRFYLENPTYPPDGPYSKDEFIGYIRAQELNSRATLGDLGPIYSKQWRKWRGSKSFKISHNGQLVHGGYDSVEIDQIKNIVYGLKTNPNSRRHVLSAWNVAELEDMALVPCHVMAQFIIDNGKLWCQMSQRSCDGPLGGPYNVASYSLLTYMIAQVCNLQPGGLIHSICDFHIYHNQIDGIKEQLTRKPYPFPSLWLNPEVKDIDDFTLDDIKIKNYKSHEAIKMPLSVGL